MILNEKQKKVVYTQEHFLFLLAGAGSGKTRVIVERIKHLINLGVSKEDILCLTFTHKAAKEMKERLNTYDLNIYTFHSLAFHALKTITSSYELIKEDNIPFNKQDLLDISTYKNSMYKKRKPKLYDSYQQYLKQHHQKDFDDLLIDYLKILNQTKKTYQYIFVDEFQDTNLLQYKIIQKLIKKDSYVLAVGDPDQSIYQFRGANRYIIDQYVKDYHAKVEILDKNYRSSPEILKIANDFIKRNHRTYKKNLIPFHQKNYETHKKVCINLEDEANFIIHQYKKFIFKGIKPFEIAVLYRNHHRASYLKKVLNQKFIDFKTGIQLLSMHQAKGLEFDCVFIIGLEDDEIPSRHTKTYMTLEEERRLMYVAVTRARKYLYLIYTKNVGNYRKKSKFYKEIKIK